jgi:uncharacterized protein
VDLETALKSGDLEEIRRLFSENASFPNVHDPLTWTPLLELAISWSPLALLEELLDLGATPNYEAVDGYPSVYAALDSKRPDRLALIETLLKHGADVNQRGINGYTPLHLAVAQKDSRAIELLLAQGADPTLKTQVDDDLTPLEEAELMGNTEGAEMLRRLLT